MKLKTIKQLKELVESRKRREEQSFKQAQNARQAHFDRADAHKKAAFTMRLDHDAQMPLSGGDLHAYQNHMILRAKKADDALQAGAGLDGLVAERRAILEGALRNERAFERLEEKISKEQKAQALKKEEQTLEEIARLKMR